MAEARSVPERWHSWDQWLRTYAVKAAITESSNSNLPGRENGPADAYRHLVRSAELTRLGMKDRRTVRAWLPRP